MRLIVAAALLVCGAPLAAERLQFDHRLYPALQQVLDSGDTGMVEFNADNPARLVDVIAVKGKSAHEWTEALEIVSIVRPRGIASARAWMNLLQREAQARCPSTFAVLTEDAVSVTFERRSSGCPADLGNRGLYRLVAGKRSWFELAVLSQAELDPAARRQWLDLLASARLD